jgi:hypothetical protein
MRLENLENEWAPLGSFLTNRITERSDDRLRILANDDQNVHTSEVQTSVNESIKRLQIWGMRENIKIQRDLVFHIQGIIHEKRPCEDDALKHLAHCYLWNDDTKMFGITYPQLASWVWARVNREHENRDLLLDRFFEEVSESSGHCLNGNMARLINVFSAIDLEICPEIESNKLSREQLQTLVAKAVREKPQDKVMEEINLLLNQAEIEGEERDAWINSVFESYDT